VPLDCRTDSPAAEPSKPASRSGQAVTTVAAGVRLLAADPVELSIGVGLGAVGALLAASGRGIAANLVPEPSRRLAVDVVLPLVFVGPIAFWTGQLFT